MAKLLMNKIVLAGHKSSRKEVLETLQRRGAVEIISDAEMEGFDRVDTRKQINIFESAASSGRQALVALNEFSPEKKSLIQSFAGRKEYSTKEFEKKLKNVNEAMSASKNLNSIQKQVNDCKTEIGRLEIKLAELEPWLSLDIPLGYLGSEKTSAFIGSVPYESDYDSLREMIKNENAELELYEIEVISSSKEQTCFAAFSHNDESDNLERALRQIGYVTPSNLFMDKPQRKKEDLIWRKEALKNQIPILEELAKSYDKDREKIEFMIDYYSLRSEKYKIINQLSSSRSAFVLSGYIPAKYAKKIMDELTDKYLVAAELYDAGEDAPVCLENKAFYSPVESITEMYAMPLENDIDPTPIMSFFFYLFFGMMFSDAGYGLIMVLATGFLLKKLNMEKRTKANMKMFFYCGISTTFWGIIFGGFFGDLIPAVAQTFFGKTIVIPSVLNPSEDPMTLLIFGIALGVVQVFVGMGIKFYLLWKHGSPIDAILDVGLWYLFVGGIILLLVGSVANIPIAGAVGQWSAIIGAVGILFTAGRKKKGIAKKVLGGLAMGGLYDVTSYISDILSYSRLMALGLATGVIASVMNLLGGLLGSGLVGIIFFIVIFIVGHAVNFGINALGAYVHTIRLQYVEFFSKFYEGGGRKFNPFRVDTKYIRFKEEKNNVNL